MGKIPFFLHGEVATWEIVIWENVHLGGCRLGNCTFRKLPLVKSHVAPWENAVGKVFHTV